MAVRDRTRKIGRLAGTALTLDVGCGRNKRPGAIGIDRLPGTSADVVADIDAGLPFVDGAFREVSMIHVIEHVGSVVAAIEEAHRVLADGGVLRIVTPHCSDASSFADPTHRWHLNSFSMRYFTQSGGFSYYSGSRFRRIRLHVRLLRAWRMLGFEFAVNRWRPFRKFWEYYLCFVIRGKVLTFELEALK